MPVCYIVITSKWALFLRPKIGLTQAVNRGRLKFSVYGGAENES